MSHVFATSKRLQVPGKNLSVDEMMVMMHGRSTESVRMKNKPIKCGFKMWAICDHGYTFYAFPHSNRAQWRDCLKYKGILSHSSAVVARLCDEIPRKAQERTGRIMYTIFMDNYFSSIKLFKLLREQELGAVRTVRSNSEGFPKELALRYKANNLPWDTIVTAVCAGGLVNGMTWIDNDAVQMLSTVQNVGDDYKKERMCRRPRLTSTNGPRVRKVFGNSATKTLPIPTIVDDYNHYMGGVDIADQLRSVYSSHMPSIRTWLSIFFWLLDTIVSNGYIILSKCDANWSNEHRKYAIDLARSLVAEHAQTTSLSIRSNRSINESINSTNNQKKRRSASVGGYVRQTGDSSNPVMHANEQHLPCRVKSASDRRACYQCRRKGCKRKVTYFFCSSCGLYLCLDGERNCFHEIHCEILDAEN